MPARRKHNVVAIAPPSAPKRPRQYLFGREASVCLANSIVHDFETSPGFACGCIRCVPRAWCIDCLKSGRSTWVEMKDWPPATEETRCKLCAGRHSGRYTMQRFGEVFADLNPADIVALFSKPRMARFEPMPPMEALERENELLRQYIKMNGIDPPPQEAQTIPVPEEIVRDLVRAEEFLQPAKRATSRKALKMLRAQRTRRKAKRKGTR